MENDFRTCGLVAGSCRPSLVVLFSFPEWILALFICFPWSQALDSGCWHKVEAGYILSKSLSRMLSCILRDVVWDRGSGDSGLSFVLGVKIQVRFSCH